MEQEDDVDVNVVDIGGVGRLCAIMLVISFDNYKKGKTNIESGKIGEASGVIDAGDDGTRGRR